MKRQIHWKAHLQSPVRSFLPNWMNDYPAAKWDTASASIQADSCGKTVIRTLQVPFAHVFPLISCVASTVRIEWRDVFWWNRQLSPVAVLTALQATAHRSASAWRRGHLAPQIPRWPCSAKKKEKEKTVQGIQTNTGLSWGLKRAASSSQPSVSWRTHHLFGRHDGADEDSNWN